jgi:putative transposase
MYVPGYPTHVVQRGHNKAPTLVTPHAEYLALGSGRAHARVAYRRLVAMPSRDEETVEIRSTLNAGYPFGSDAFRERVAQALGRSVGQLARGGRRQAGQKASTTTR